MQLYLMRHARTPWNEEGRFQGREDLAISQKGREEAQAAGVLLREWAIDRVAVSPLRRAKETAELFCACRETALPVEVAPGLIERDYGRVAGLLPKEREALLQSGEETGIEPGPAVAERALAALRALGAPGDKRILVVTHGGVINQVLIAVSRGRVQLGGPALKNLCINRLTRKEDGSFVLDYCNKTPAELSRELHP